MSTMITLYHDTTSIQAHKIKQNGFDDIRIPRIDQVKLGKSKQRPGSLGYGLYGFQDDAGLAAKFISKFTQTGMIVKFQVCLEFACVLNFVDSLTDMQLFSQWQADGRRQRLFKGLKQQYQNKVSQAELDGAMIEIYIVELLRHRLVERIDAVCSATHTVLANQPNSQRLPNGIEYAIRSNNSIQRMTIQIVKNGGQ